jgi:hypothetical protein
MLRSLSSRRRRLTALVAALVVAVLGAGLAQAALGGSDSGPKPPPRSLASAVLAAVQAPPVEGITARVRLTNDLVPPGSVPRGTALPWGADAEGRLWLSRDGRMRLDLRSDTGNAEIVSDGRRVSVYDAGSNTLSRFTLAVPALRGGGREPLAGLAEKLGPLLSMWNVSGAKPTSTAGRPTYTVRVSPRDDGGLLGAAELAWDADHGVPLRAAVYEQGESEPVLELAATDVDFGRVTGAELAARPHPGAKVVEIDGTKVAPKRAPHATVSGVEAVRRRLDFPLAAPRELAGLPRRSVHLVRTGKGEGAVSVYGRGLGAIVVFQGGRGAGAATPLAGLDLPQVNIDGRTGTELATALGTVVTFERGGVTYTVAGSVPPAAAENAARGLR